MFRAIFLDRDGVIIENRPGYVRSWSDVEILPGVPQALSGLGEYKLVVVTNQSAVGRGLMTLDAAQAINDQLIKEIRKQKGQIDAVYMCPHVPDARCSCRKPNPGLLIQAAHELSLDLGQSWMIGDAWTDLLAGQAAGVRRVAFVRTGRGNEQLRQPRPETLDDYYVFNDLVAALSSIQKLGSLPTALERSRQARR